MTNAVSITEDLNTDENGIKNITYQADIIQADLDNESASLKGNVVISFDGYQLYAKQAEIFRKENKFIATGDVKIESIDSEIVAEEVEIFFNNKNGKLKKARLISGQMLFEADEISKIGKDVFNAKNATFTTCITCPPIWRFKASEIETNINKYVDIKNSYFQLGGQSVFWVPRAILPVNTRRKTGLSQFPKPGYLAPSKQGYLELEYFWAIAENKDFTYNPIIYQKSGIKSNINYRHLFSAESKLELNAGYLKDDRFSDFNFTTGTESEITRKRWFIDFKNQFTLPGDFIQKSDIRLVDDLLYVSDFANEIKGQGEPALVNQISLIHNKDLQHFSTEIIYNINLLTEDVFSKNLDSVHKTPQIRYSILNTSFLNDRFFYKFDSEYVKFSRRETSFDEVINPGGDPPRQVNPTPVGQFNPGSDLIRSGHRLILRPEISSTIQLGNFFRLEPSARYHQALYIFDPQTNMTVPGSHYSNYGNTGYVEGELNLRTQVSKVLNSRWKHILEPQISFIRGEILTQSDNIFFKSTRGLPFHRRFQPITDNDFFDFEHGIQFDYNDRIYDTNILQVSLLQTFLRKNKESGITYYDQPVYFDLSQTYDFMHAQKSPNPDPWSNLNGTLIIKGKQFETFTSASHFHKLNRTNVSTRNKYIYKTGHFIQTQYKNVYIFPTSNNPNTFVHQEFFGFGLGWEMPFFHLSGNLLYSTLDDQIQSWDIRAAILPPGNCWQINLYAFNNINRRNNDQPDLKFDFQWNFGDDAKMKRPRNVNYTF